MTKFRTNLHAAVAALGVVMTACSAAAQGTDLPRLQTNEAYVNEVTTRTQKLAIDDPMAVFAYVLGSLPDRVKVYPTENHYYFSFDLNGTRYAGNIKIDAYLRAQGKVEFSYYEDRGNWLEDSHATGLTLDASRGVGVEKIDSLTYRLTYRNKSVIFALNDLTQVKPPAAALAPDDKFIGPVFDEFRRAVLPRIQQPAQIISLRSRRNDSTCRHVRAGTRRRRPYSHRQTYGLCRLSRSASKPEDSHRRLS